MLRTTQEHYVAPAQVEMPVINNLIEEPVVEAVPTMIPVERKLQLDAD